MLILTLAAWLYCRHRNVHGKYPIKILLTVPSGFKEVKQPTITHKLISALGPKLPVATIILFLEHIAISKCEEVTVPYGKSAHPSPQLLGG